MVMFSDAVELLRLGRQLPSSPRTRPGAHVSCVGQSTRLIAHPPFGHLAMPIGHAFCAASEEGHISTEATLDPSKQTTGT
jgi:hypothetical protein